MYYTRHDSLTKRPGRTDCTTLLDESVYLYCLRTVYRILDDQDEVRTRRNQLRHPNHPKPELLATASKHVWSWDITKLLGPAKWVYFNLYDVLDVFSRYVVGWMVGEQESTALAKRLIAPTCAKQGIVPGQLTIHADCGSSACGSRCDQDSQNTL